MNQTAGIRHHTAWHEEQAWDSKVEMCLCAHDELESALRPATYHPLPATRHILEMSLPIQHHQARLRWSHVVHAYQWTILATSQGT